MTAVFTDEDRRELAGRARTLAERLDGPANVAESSPPIDPERVLDEWRATFPDEEAFRARLARDDLTEAAVREQAAATRWPADEPLPDWVDRLSALVRRVEASTADDRDAGAIPDETPFRELLAAVVSFARERVSVEAVPTETLSSLERQLAGRLESLCVRALYVEFKSFVEYHDPELAATSPDDVAEPPTDYYERFVAAMFDGGFDNLCLEYPVLARQLVSLVDDWRNAVEELCRRVAADRDALRERFDVRGDVTGLEALTEDAHAGGRVPVRVAFEEGAVVYKPRPVGGEIAVYEVLDRLDDHLSTPDFETPSLLARDSYGWMELCEYRDLPDAEAADDYYERAGTLLCLAYVLNFTDCHYENVVAEGDLPTILDGETVFHPHVESEAKPFETEASAAVDRSVLLSVLLPFSVGDPRADRGGRFADKVAGLGSDGEETALPGKSEPTIEAVNTDVMSVEMDPVTVDPNTNTPSAEGSDRPPEEYVEALIRGFEETYETVRDLREASRFLSEIADPELVAGVETRLLYRSTGRYAEVLRSAAARNPLRDGARLTVEFEELAVPFFDGTVESDRLWELYAAERRSLRRLDVPRFASRADERTLLHRGERLDGTVDVTGYEFVRRRLDAMSDEDRRRQTWLIRQAVGEVTTAEGPPPSGSEASGGEAAGEKPQQADRFRRAAIDCFEGAMDARVEVGDDPGWVSIVPESGINLYPADDSLFWGRGGVALTAAALAEMTGRERYREFAAEALAPVVERVFDGSVEFAHGGMQGIGSVVYVLSVAAELLGEDRYREAALAATETVTGERVADADTFDVVDGVAGTLLGLLAYYERYGDAEDGGDGGKGGGEDGGEGGDEVLARAADCGDRLLDARTDVDGYRVWETTGDEVPYTGFAHGSSGIAYALARLAAATDDDRYAEATREALEFESSLYSPSRTNWRQAATRESYQDRWCHGRTGMALARIGIGERLGDDALVADAGDALAATGTGEASNLDNLCCGNFGRVEALLVGARRAGCDDALAGELAARCLARREREGVLSLPAHDSSFANPTLFDGVAGPSYALSRLLNPDALPCVLLLE
ncbi:type 2 lanthipeptide synthetase LanM family protein [Halorussus gelatinilyticus]|uniref:Type 2 lanthipeptide synthetase LanM family protein n=1 Tax=Halorussus gelatinilyticus TaxID=2937524 RepID=A0A8U0IH51_9EURY|nr:type 2 lanthipeptide synthetase LanM family protein [Halorussus gelatinilyticus]UPW00045.1 type 2 lanthipeptide synthetase LanM family protein [Halorussus gelatinilyticus]